MLFVLFIIKGYAFLLVIKLGDNGLKIVKKG